MTIVRKLDAGPVASKIRGASVRDQCSSKLLTCHASLV
jgi:hypothetical protein